MTEDLDPEQRVQEEQYEFPYHYIPSFEGGFSQAKYWSWGFRYLGGIRVVLDELASKEFDSLVDVGCGDGRVLREIADRYPDRDLLGIDYSERAIELGRTLNPDLEFEVADVGTFNPSKPFDVATAVEVLEHIPPTDLDEFIFSVAELLSPGGTLVATVPHANTSVNPKHYQHFTEEELREALTPHFGKVRTIPIDARTKSLSLLQKFIGGKGSHFLIMNPRVLSTFFKIYEIFYLYTDEDKCGRLAAVCSK